MKKNLLFLIPIAMIITFFSCKNSSDNSGNDFIGKWVDCDKGVNFYVITKQGSIFNVHFYRIALWDKSDTLLSDNFVLTKTSDGLFQNAERQLSVTYDKLTFRLKTIDHSYSFDFCKVNN